MYQDDPLSASTMPCTLSASATTRACGSRRDVSKSARSRNHAPIGGAVAALVEPAWCRAGHT